MCFITFDILLCFSVSEKLYEPHVKELYFMLNISDRIALNSVWMECQMRIGLSNVGLLLKQQLFVVERLVFHRMMEEAR